MFFVTTSKEEYAEEFISETMLDMIYGTRIPYFKKTASDKSIKTTINKKAMQGYVFVESALNNIQFYRKCKNIICCNNIYRLVNYEVTH